MPQPFSSLQRKPTKEQILESLVAMLKGIGLTTHTGYSPGGVTITGIPPSDGELLVKIITTGRLGAGEYQYSVDGGSSWTSTATIPADGLVALSVTGLTLVFTDAAVGLESFLVDDIFTVAFTVPTWPLTSWEEGAAGRTILELYATVMEDVYSLISDISAGGFLQLARGDWLDLLAQSVYDEERIPGVVTEGEVLFSDPTGVGPFNLNNGDVVLASDDGLMFILSENITVPLSGSVSGLVRAERAGAQYNVGNESITTLVTAVPGLAVLNQIFANGTWITTAGTDTESNEEFVLRCMAKWQSLAVGLPASMYDIWSKAADAAVNRSYARVSPTVAGQVDLFVAGPGGAVSGGVVANVQAYVDQRTALTNTVLVASVTNHPQTVTATVNVFSAYLVSATAAVTASITALFASKGIGATLYLSELYDAIQGVQGVRDVTITVPAANVALDADEIFVFTNNLTFIGV